jgi:hypothetical protein
VTEATVLRSRTRGLVQNLNLSYLSEKQAIVIEKSEAIASLGDLRERESEGNGE